MTVAENVALSGLGLGRVDRAAVRRRVIEAMERIGVRLDPDQLVSTLSIGERQRVEIVKALFHDCRVVILDEPTAVLTPQDVRALFDTVRRLTSAGLGVLLVSHKLREVAEISDRVVVLRRGRLVGTRMTGEVDDVELAALMMGSATAPTAVEESAEAALGLPAAATPLHRRSGWRGGRARARARGARPLPRRPRPAPGREHPRRRRRDRRRGRHLRQRADRARRRPQRRRGAHVRVDPGRRDRHHPHRRRRPARAGLGRLTEDRKGSVVPPLSVEYNLVLEDLPAYSRRGLLDRAAVRRHAEAMIERFDIRARPTDSVSTLSGGNMQKVLLARALHRGPRILVASQPTRGLDIGACRYVHEQLRELRDTGAGVLLVSEDLDELRSLSDRIVVLFRGEIVGDVTAADVSTERLGVLMAGGVVAA